MIHLLVCGSRTLEDKQNYIETALSRITKNQPLECIISGMARGADIISYHWAVQNGIKVLEFPANWEKDGRAAGPIRNIKMLNESGVTHVIAFIDKRDSKNPSKGTNHMIEISKKKGIPVKIIYVK